MAEGVQGELDCSGSGKVRRTALSTVRMIDPNKSGCHQNAEESCSVSVCCCLLVHN